MTCLPNGRRQRERAQVAYQSERGYQPSVPPVPPPGELLAFNLLGEEAEEEAMKVVVSGYRIRSSNHLNSWAGGVD